MSDEELKNIRERNERCFPGCSQQVDVADDRLVWDRGDVRKLIAEIERLRAENERLRESAKEAETLAENIARQQRWANRP